MPPVCALRRLAQRGHLERAAKLDIEQVAHPRRAVVEEIVVSVVPVLFARVDGQPCRDVGTLRRGEVQFLTAQVSLMSSIHVERSLKIGRVQPVALRPQGKANAEHEQTQRPVTHAEGAEVVHDVGMGDGIANPEGIVAEALVNVRTRAHRHQVDLEIGARFLRGKAAGAGHQRGRENNQFSVTPMEAPRQTRGDSDHRVTARPDSAES